MWNIGLENQLPIYTLALALLDPNSPQDATSRKGKTLSNMRKEHIRKDRPIFIYLKCSDSIIYPILFMVVTFGPFTYFLFK